MFKAVKRILRDLDRINVVKVDIFVRTTARFTRILFIAIYCIISLAIETFCEVMKLGFA